MKWRQISEQEVQAVVGNPEVTEETKRGRVNVFKRLGGRFIKVTYKEVGEEIVIISPDPKF